MKFTDEVKEMAKSYKEEEAEAVKALLEIAGFEPDYTKVDPFRNAGYKIDAFKPNAFDTFFVLSFKKQFVAGAVVSLNYELNQVKRTMIPHFSELDEKFHKFIKHL